MATQDEFVEILNNSLPPDAKTNIIREYQSLAPYITEDSSRGVDARKQAYQLENYAHSQGYLLNGQPSNGFMGHAFRADGQLVGAGTRALQAEEATHQYAINSAILRDIDNLNTIYLVSEIALGVLLLILVGMRFSRKIRRFQIGIIKSVRTIGVINMSKWIAISVAAICIIAAFGIFIWPTRYRYDHSDFTGKSVMVRIDRFSGTVEALSGNGWVRLKE